MLLAFAMIVTFWSVSRVLSTVMIFIPAVLVSFIFYFFTARKNSPEPEKVLPLYLIALAVQFFHFLEEYLTGFTVRVAELPGQSEMVMETWIIFNMCAYAAFVLGGIALLKKNKEFMIIPIFFVIVGVVLNAVGHVLISLYVGGYFPGLYTALIYFLLGPMLVKRFLVAVGET